jgi:hypothetical protein
MNAEDLLQDGATSLRFELVWEEVGSGGQEALLITLLDGSIRAEGILSHDLSDVGRFEEIDRAHWASVTREAIHEHLSRFAGLSLAIHDDGLGYSSILLKRSPTLLDLLDYQLDQARVDFEAADIAWHKANGQFFGHKVTSLAQAALFRGIVEPRPAMLKAFLLSHGELWPNEPPGDEALKKFCATSIKAFKDAARLRPAQ